MHHVVSWWSSPPRNGMIYLLLESCFSRPHHNNSCRFKLPQINFKKFYCATKGTSECCVWDIPYWLLHQKPVLMKIGVLSKINKHVTPSSIENIFQTSEMLHMDNIYVSTAMKEWLTPIILVTSLDTKILSGVTQRGWPTPCRLYWYINTI